MADGTKALCSDFSTSRDWFYAAGTGFTQQGLVLLSRDWFFTSRDWFYSAGTGFTQQGLVLLSRDWFSTSRDWFYSAGTGFTQQGLVLLSRDWTGPTAADQCWSDRSGPVLVRPQRTGPFRPQADRPCPDRHRTVPAAVDQDWSLWLDQCCPTAADQDWSDRSGPVRCGRTRTGPLRSDQDRSAAVGPGPVRCGRTSTGPLRSDQHWSAAVEVSPLMLVNAPQWSGGLRLMHAPQMVLLQSLCGPTAPPSHLSRGLV
ncbi:unnamed protein product [Boreogadus saida]